MDLPSWLPDYIGPYISNGKLQESVEFGDIRPTSSAEYHSRLHDSAYAKYKDRAHRRAADYIYDKSLGGALGKTVLYGNQVASAASNIFESSKFGIFGLAYAAIKNQLSVVDWAMNKDKYIKEVVAYYATDPFHYTLPKNGEEVGNEIWSNSLQNEATKERPDVSPAHPSARTGVLRPPISKENYSTIYSTAREDPQVPSWHQWSHPRSRYRRRQLA